MTEEQQPERVTVLCQAIYDQIADYDLGILNGGEEQFSPYELVERILDVFQEHFNSKADDINTLIARESDTCSDLAGDIRAILFGDES